MRLAAVMLVALFGACSEPEPITAVSVRDANFQIVKTLTSAELPEFTRLWEEKEEIRVPPPSLGGQHFKLDITSRDLGGRWLYQTTGYVQYLDPKTKPVYKLHDSERFNRLIGAAK